MDIFTLLIIGHIIGSVLGVGGATMVEFHINRALKDSSMSPDERNLLGADFLMTRIGLVLSILTGLGFIYVYWASNQMFRLESGVFWAKMGMIVVIIVNAYLLDKHRIGLYWGSALSFFSWWFAFLAGLFLTHNIKIYPQDQVITFGVLMSAYILAVVAGAYILHSLRERRKVVRPKESAVASPTQTHT